MGTSEMQCGGCTAPELNDLYGNSLGRKTTGFKPVFNICHHRDDPAYLLPIFSLMLMAIIDADRVFGFGKKQPAFNKNACHMKQQRQPNAHGRTPV